MMSTSTNNLVKSFSIDQICSYLEGITVYRNSNNLDEDNESIDKNDIPNHLCSTCVCCHIELHSLEEQRIHFKSTSHKLNLQDYVKERKKEETMVNLTEEECLEDAQTDLIQDIPKIGKTFFINSTSQILSVYTVVIMNKKENNIAVENLRGLSSRNKWLIIMISGGHFAACVFHGKMAVCHKAFHSYTVRAGQGGNQSSKDNQSGTRHPNSAGSSLRRYNELSFIAHFQEVMISWKDEIRSCDLIFYRLPNSNAAAMFGGKHPCFDKDDLRLRKIPFITRKPSFKEVQRVHELLYSFEVYESEKDFASKFAKSNPKARKKVENSPKADVKHTISLPSSSSEEEDIVLTTEWESFHTSELNPFGCFIPKQKNHDTPISPSKLLTEKDLKNSKFKNQIYSYCRDGNLVRLEDTGVQYITFLNGKLLEEPTDKETLIKEFWELMGTEVFGQKCKTLLHICSEAGNYDMIKVLIEKGVDLTLKTADKKTAYQVAKDRRTKEEFRKYMAEHPDKFDYKAAGILIPLTEEMLRTKEEKKQKHRKIKKEKEKERKAEEVTRKNEEEERNRFLQLSDREKRALAADRRIMLLNTNQILARCFMCGTDISGKVPFEYSNNRFCSTNCIKQHRQLNKK